jgi:hypothetical protein
MQIKVRGGGLRSDVSGFRARIAIAIASVTVTARAGFGSDRRATT